MSTSASRFDEAHVRSGTPPKIAGSEGQANTSHPSTPSIPPGLVTKSSLLAELPAATSKSDSRPNSRASLQRTSVQIQPAIPIRSSTPDKAPSRIGTPQITQSQTQATSATQNAVTDSAKRKQRADATESKEELGETGAQWIGEPAKVSISTISQPETEEKLGSSTRGRVPKEIKPGRSLPADVAKTTTEKSANHVEDMRGSGTLVESPRVRAHSGKADVIAAPKEHGQATAEPLSQTENNAATNATRGSRKSSQLTISAGGVPDSPGVASPTARMAPRTLRLVSTPRSEASPPTAGTSQPLLGTPVLEKAKQLSRQHSVTSTPPPGTPSSEHVSISDTISVTSTSLSRANTPPPTAVEKIGNLRAKTKSQQKKERQDRARQVEVEKSKETAPVKPSADESVHQEAILSRKKKTKKEKEPKPPKARQVATTAVSDTTPTASRPASPADKLTSNEQLSSGQSKNSPAPAMVPQPIPPPQMTEPSPPPTPDFSPARLIADLRASGPEIQKCLDNFVRVSSASQFKVLQSMVQKDPDNSLTWTPDMKINLKKGEAEALLRGKIPAVRYGGDDGRVWDRGMITPSGAHLRALTEELESRFLELETAIRVLPEELRFHPTKPQNDTKFPRIELEALKRQFENITSRMPSVMEQMLQDGTPGSIQSKRNAVLADEASKYINEYVMPPATPPPGAGATRHGQGGAVGAVPSAEQPQTLQLGVDILERQLAEAKRIAEGHEQQLRKAIKKNRKLAGF